VKTLTSQNGKIVLSPANPAERDIEVGPGDDFGILGVVCGVFRPFVTMESQTAEMPKS
jgi:SOS-response transcriptional repressor LexA